MQIRVVTIGADSQLTISVFGLTALLELMIPLEMKKLMLMILLLFLM